jgi:hypothetical protein
VRAWPRVRRGSTGAAQSEALQVTTPQPKAARSARTHGSKDIKDAAPAEVFDECRRHEQSEQRADMQAAKDEADGARALLKVAHTMPGKRVSFVVFAQELYKELVIEAWVSESSDGANAPGPSGIRVLGFRVQGLQCWT